MEEKFKLPDEFIIKPKKSVEKLQELRFDPIERMVTLYDRISGDINNMLSNDEEGNPKKYSQIALGTLISIQQKISADLIRYGYARTPETVEIEQKNVAPLQIMLTSGDTFTA